MDIGYEIALSELHETLKKHLFEERNNHGSTDSLEICI